MNRGRATVAGQKTGQRLTGGRTLGALVPGAGTRE